MEWSECSNEQLWAALEMARRDLDIVVENLYNFDPDQEDDPLGAEYELNEEREYLQQELVAIRREIKLRKGKGNG